MMVTKHSGKVLHSLALDLTGTPDDILAQVRALARDIEVASSRAAAADARPEPPYRSSPRDVRRFRQERLREGALFMPTLQQQIAEKVPCKTVGNRHA